MDKLIDKIKSMNKIVLVTVAFFVVVAVANMLGYGG